MYGFPETVTEVVGPATLFPNKVIVRFIGVFKFRIVNDESVFDAPN
jgi:hypothetical protein